MEPISRRLGEAIYEPGSPLHHAVFPTTSIVSLNYVSATGASSETSSVSKEGMVGLALSWVVELPPDQPSYWWLVTPSGCQWTSCGRPSMTSARCAL